MTCSSFCGNAACVEVRGDSDTVYVRDSKLGDDSSIQEWPVDDWLFLVDAIVLKLDRKQDRFTGFRGYLTRDDGSVRLGWARLDHPVQVYTAEEWKAFEYGCRAGEFDPDRLTEKFKSSSFDPRETVEEDRAGVVTREAAPTQPAAAGAERSSSPPAPAVAPFTNLQRVRAIVLTQIRLGGLKSEIAEAIVADLQEGGLIVADLPAVETPETGS